ncbi:MAG: Na+/H+ antiporter subunit E [Acidovorax sp.]|uniref:Na+/H+ antiporter subunit E n=1 Tax=Acidovorax sp. TaxID=1872122 RepID=UPI0039E70601
MLKRLFPAPLLSAGLFAVWLLLNQSVSAGQIVMGVLVALVVPALTAGLRPRRVRVRHPLTVLRLALTVAADATRSNLQVARFLLLPSQRRHAADFVTIPLELRDPNALAALAVIVCITPGTAWAELSLDRSMLMLHVLEVDDRQALIDHVKQRYERPLMEIFEP